jgi:methanogenic corrinoid protein MtbC1
MQSLSLNERTQVCEKIDAVKQQVAATVTEQFFLRHPDWLTRYGDRGRLRGIEDAAFHQSYLASAIEGGSVVPFETYARWTVGVLESRNIASHFVAENLVQIGEALQSSLTPVEAEFVNEFIAAGVLACETPAAPTPATTVETALGEMQALYLQAAIKGERRAAVTLALEALKQVNDVVDVYVDVFQTSQVEVGRLWETNRITIAEEHMATAITQYAMAQLYQHIEPDSSQAGKMVITGIEGEMHQIGPNMVADVLEARGWDVRFLGTNMPNSGIIQAIEEHGADTVGISATILVSIPKVVRLVKDMQAKFGAACPRLIFGGRAFSSTPLLCRELGGGEAALDLRSALASA